MAYPVILWDSILRNTGATVTATSTDTGYSIASASDYLAWKEWKSGVLTSPIDIDIDLGASGSDNADSLALINHNLTTLGATVTVYADATTIGTTTAQAAYTPTYDDVDLKTFTAPGNRRYWRIRIAHASPPFSAKPFIGEVFLGMRTTLPEFLDSATDPFFRQTEAGVEHSEGGHYLGAILRGQTHRQDLGVSSVGIARSFWTSDLKAFDQNHLSRMRPFVFQIDADDADFSRPFYLVKGEGGVSRSAIGGVWSRLGFRTPVVEAWSEAA